MASIMLRESDDIRRVVRIGEPIRMTRRITTSAALYVRRCCHGVSEEGLARLPRRRPRPPRSGAAAERADLRVAPRESAARARCARAPSPCRSSCVYVIHIHHDHAKCKPFASSQHVHRNDRTRKTHVREPTDARSSSGTIAMRFSMSPLQSAALMSPSDQLDMQSCWMLPLADGSARSPFSVGVKMSCVSRFAIPSSMRRLYQ